MKKPSTIAIDGPAASGKTTVSRLLARKLGYRFVDTGATYRALTWEAVSLGIDLEDEEALERLAENTRIELASGEDEGIFVNGRYVNAELRSPEVEHGVSPVAKVAGVRKVLVQQQRMIANGGRIVMAGRDIGTNVLPDADLKIYLDVSVEQQAERRYREIIGRGEEADFDGILAGLKRRDEIDSGRAVNPLRKAADAYLINTDGMTVEEEVAEILRIIGER